MWVAAGLVIIFVEAVTDIYLKQVAVQHHMNEYINLETKKEPSKNAPMHSNPGMLHSKWKEKYSNE